MAREVTGQPVIVQFYKDETVDIATYCIGGHILPSISPTVGKSEYCNKQAKQASKNGQQYIQIPLLETSEVV